MNITNGSAGQYVDAAGAAAYNQARHGKDGALLLDPVFIGHIEKFCPGKEVLDAGCGAAPWTIRAAEVGAKTIYAVDNSEQMLGNAQEQLGKQPEAVRGIVDLQLVDANDIPKSDDSFDVGLSLNVGCAIPNLVRHFKEMSRVLRPDGIGIITAPVTLEVPFTTFGDEEAKIAHLEEDLRTVSTEAEMRQKVVPNTDILRATIVLEGAHWKLIKEAGELALGQSIMRKIPGPVVPNFFHTSDEYEAAIDQAGFSAVETTRLRLSPEDYTAETGLGSQYIEHNAFDIYLVRNQAT